MLTDKIQPNDRRSCRCDEEKQITLACLLKIKAWKVILRIEIPEKANILKRRFLLAIKDGGTDNYVQKAIFVLQGHCDAMDNLLFMTYLWLDII